METPTAVASQPAPARAAASRAAGAPSGRGPYRFAVAVVLATLVLIKAGAMVTSTGSGLAFEDWPLADGSWWPPDMELAGLLEHGHRAIGALIGLLVLALTVWIGVRERRAWLRRLAVGVLALVCLQGVIGGVGVLEGLPAVTSVTHGVLAQVILCLLALVAFALSPAWGPRHAVPASQAYAARKLAAIAVGLVFAQLFVGAVVRHTDARGLLWLHVFMAMGVALWIAITALYCGTRFGDLGFRGLGRGVLSLLLLQLVLGFVTLAVRQAKDPSNVEYLGRSLVVTSHVVVGALLFLSAALLLYRSARNLRPAAEP